MNGSLHLIQDVELENHLSRVKFYTKKLLVAHNERCQLNLCPNYMDLVIEKSFIHDLGKAGIPEKILKKAGRLTPTERTIVETHPLIGAYIFKKLAEEEEISQASLDYAVAENIILYHHEKWDGSGYPNGLEKESIPLEARIVAVVDVFDALTSERCYKRSWSDEEAILFLEEQSGKHFDPEIIDSFVEVVKEKAIF